MTSITSTTQSSLIQSGTGLGSGINIGSIVSQLVTVEGQAVYNRINNQESRINSHLSGLGTLKSALSSFQTAVNALKTGTIFQTNAATSSNESVLKVTPGSGSVAASHSIEVDHLATAQSSITTAVDQFASTSDTVGTGTLTFSPASGSAFTSFSVTIDSSNNTLLKVRDAINNASGNNSVSASIVNVDNSTGTGTISKLVLTAKNTGTAYAFNVTGTDTGDSNNTDNAGLSRLFSSNLSTTSASDAVIKLDGQTATRSSNTITDVLQGVTLNLLSAPGSATPVNVGVSVDTSAISKAVSNFVTAYNTMHSTAQTLGAYGGVGGTNGALMGDSTLQFVSSKLRQNSTDVVSSASGGYNSLAMIGVTVDQYGVMALDSTKLNAALSANIQSVSNVFSSSNGVATRLSSTLDNLLHSGGTFDSQTKSLNAQTAALEKQRAAEQSYLDSYQASLQKQFTAMDTLVGQYNSTSSYLSQWISKGG